ncbi:hypothetical protein [Marinomonas balearica]|uniref:Uncharacterized protein n=1 Tax=Marinomonas balearica TaxID=491947 RepID=A0A4R6MDL6_9GAMM|nr:hypothetical protein [Marinomonas balearica]TDO99818.1 hypothetical protein DFP79_0826 [Marinomonas balearica]
MQFDPASIEQLDRELNQIIMLKDVAALTELDKRIRAFNSRALTAQELKANQALLQRFADTIAKAQALIREERQKAREALNQSKRKRPQVKQNISKMRRYHEVNKLE